MIEWLPPLIGLGVAGVCAAGGMTLGHFAWKRHEHEATAFTESLKRIPLRAARVEPTSYLNGADKAWLWANGWEGERKPYPEHGYTDDDFKFRPGGQR